MGGTGAVLAMALLCPLLPIGAWALAVAIAFQDANGAEAIVNQAAALEIPFFNALLAGPFTEDNVEEQFREGLKMGLRVVEDAPELPTGLLDLAFFGGAWYAWLGIAMAAMMVAFPLIMGLLTCHQNARELARRLFTQQINTE